MLENTILFGKWENHIDSIPSGSVSLIVTDPPYQVTPLKWDKRPEWVYFMKQMARISGDSGQMWIFCRMPWAIDMHLAAVQHGWIFVQERIWQKQNGSGATVKTFRKVHENIWQYKRKNSKTFNLNEIREPKTTTGDKSIKAGKGRSSCQYITNKVEYIDDGLRMPKSVLFCPNLHQSKESLGHSTQKPEEVIRPLILYSSNEGDLVFDPFSGAGTTPCVAKQAGRRWLATEMVEKWHSKSIERVSNTTLGQLSKSTSECHTPSVDKTTNKSREKGEKDIFDE